MSYLYQFFEVYEKATGVPIVLHLSRKEDIFALSAAFSRLVFDVIRSGDWGG